MVAAFAPFYLALVPVTSWLSRPNGILSKAIGAVASVVLIPGSGSSTSSVPADRIIPALSTVYIFWTFGASGAFSAAGQAMSRPAGLDDRNPREFIGSMRGMPQRLRSAHYNLMENFPGFALAAALAQALAPHDQQIANLLGLHVLLKLFVYYPAYLADVPPPRTLAHVMATAAVINVCWRLALGA